MCVRNSLSKNCGVSVCVVFSESSEWAYRPETDHSRTRTPSAGARNSDDTGARYAAMLQHSSAGPTITQKTLHSPSGWFKNGQLFDVLPHDGVAGASAADAASDTTTLAGVASAGGAARDMLGNYVRYSRVLPVNAPDV